MAAIETDFLDSSHFAGSLTGKMALVTGAGRGIGKAIAIALARAGCAVACVSRTRSEVEAVAGYINSECHSRAKAFVCDISDVNSIDILVTDVQSWTISPMYALVNSAGATRIEAMEYVRDNLSAWNRIMATNLTGPVTLIYKLLPDFLSRGGGVIISIGSRNSIYPIPYMMAYSVSKTGLLRFHENLEREVRGRGIFNYYVVPGNVETSILTGTDVIDDESIRCSAGVQQMVEMISQSKKDPADLVANTCVWLTVDKHAAILSGRYIDTEGNLCAVAEDIRRGSDSRCLQDDLYRLSMEML